MALVLVQGRESVTVDVHDSDTKPPPILKTTPASLRRTGYHWIRLLPQLDTALPMTKSSNRSVSPSLLLCHLASGLITWAVSELPCESQSNQDLLRIMELSDRDIIVSAGSFDYSQGRSGLGV